MFGNSAGMCAASGAASHEERLAAAQRLTKSKRAAMAQAAPLREDALPGTMCLRCGMRGQHATAETCIDALRDRLADLE